MEGDINVRRGLREHRILEKNNANGEKVHAINFTESPYNGIIFSYGKVNLVPDEDKDELQLRFEYEIHQEPLELYVKEDLETYLGDFLTLLIIEQMNDREIVYHGGTDDNREANLDESNLRREVQSKGYTLSDPEIFSSED